jgi:uncharacterized protein
MVLLDKKQLKTINMYFASSRFCNLRCRYCYVPQALKATKANDDLVIKRLKKFLNKTEKEGYQIGSFVLHGAEPALMSAETLIEVVSLMQDHWLRHGQYKRAVGIQSNGTLWTPEYLQKLKMKLPDMNMLRLGFSIDPPKEVHDQNRDGSFNRVISHYETALEMGFPVSVLSVVSEETLQYKSEFAEWMKVQLKRQAQDGNPFKIKSKLATVEWGLNESQVKEFARLIVEEKLFSLIQILTPGYCIQDGNECFWFEFDLEGNAYSCNKQFNESGIFASWFEQTFDEIFEKRAGLFQNYSTHPDCELCPYQFICNSGCPVDRFKNGSMAGKAHECELIQAVGDYLDAEGISLAELMNRH